jgi:hypothetical protein
LHAELLAAYVGEVGGDGAFGFGTNAQAEQVRASMGSLLTDGHSVM